MGMRIYEEFLSERYLGLLKQLVKIDEFSSVGKAIEWSIVDLLIEHASFGHIEMYEPHTAQTLIKKGYYPNQEEFIRESVRKFLKKKGMWSRRYN